MFTGFCTETDALTLMGPRRMTAFQTTSDGVEFDYVCVCGATGHYDARAGTGRHSTTETVRMIA
jgi:hypothetical protein